ncbi:hypothetical protein L7F22_059921 [Adiantum nelumboides]|nr:hypothetical protein [Adiantum nelumboides]
MSPLIDNSALIYNCKTVVLSTFLTGSGSVKCAVDNALADGPRGDEPAAAKLAASLAEEDEAAQDGAEIVAAPNPAIGEAACMSHPFWMTAPCLPAAAEAHLWHFEPQVAYLEAHLPTSWPSIAFDPGGQVDHQAVCLNALVLPISILIYQVANLYNLLYCQYTLSSTSTNTPKDACVLSFRLWGQTCLHVADQIEPIKARTKRRTELLDFFME